ncbi:MAG: sigma 54-interacting transcriptional regulator [bacterium]
MNKLKILIAEDEKLARMLMAEHLPGHSLDFATNRETAEKKLNSGDYDLCFIDLKLGKDDDYSGFRLIPIAAKRGIYSVVMTSSREEEVIDKAYKLGCTDFYIKGNEEENIAAVLMKYRQKTALKNSDDIFSRQFVTEDQTTRESVRKALNYAPADIPRRRRGPTGTGTTCLAQVLHGHSHRRGEFVAINCSAYTEDLLEVELFGCKRGAFTDAHENRKGKLLQADRGTLFLDEIGSMSRNMQTKLLKAIEERTFYPVGSDKPEHSEFRVMSATLENVEKLIATERLRFDFFQRIYGCSVNLKPLSQRRCDILPLIAAFTRESKRLSFEKDAKAFLLNHSWPGNIRELRKLVELASATDGMVTLDMVERHMAQTIRREKPAADGFLTAGQYEYASKNGVREATDRLTYEIIRRKLQETNNKKIKTRRELKISKRMLYSMLKKFKGKPEDLKTPSF